MVAIRLRSGGLPTIVVWTGPLLSQEGRLLNGNWDAERKGTFVRTPPPIKAPTARGCDAGASAVISPIITTVQDARRRPINLRQAR